MPATGGLCGPSSSSTLTVILANATRPRREWALVVTAVTGGVLVTLYCVRRGPCGRRRSAEKFGCYTPWFALPLRSAARPEMTRANNDDTRLASDGLAGVTREAGAPVRGRLAADQHFGPYRIVREVGRGGMGEVYEADEVETGRRVALKLLSHALVDRQAIDRFLREGRLAASVSHPNSVYIFGSHEIDGIPVIAMELVSGGTFEDLVERQGPLAPTAAVEAALQLIAGLEAAESRGVLHRDIKPSNAFVDAAGVVKIGDYGLSVSTSGGDETRLTMAGTFLGTPAYASPEQVRAAALDVRSDIYSVGATLHFLLTGQPPFPQKGAMQVLAAVLQDTPESPRKIARVVPEALAQVVLRCLKKDPAARYASYASLRQALLAFSRQPVTTAPLSLRFGASLIDTLVLALIVTAPMHSVTVRWQGWLALAAAVLQIALKLPYYAVLEGRYGTTLGKRLLGLRVVSANGTPAGLARAAIRAAVFLTVYAARDFVPWPDPVTFGLALLALFATARRRSGLRGLHEVASGTRTVVATRALVSSRKRQRPSTVRPVANGALTLGGYAVRERLWERDGEALDAAWDSALDRTVWIHHVAPQTSPLSPVRQMVARQTRLRWLASRRSADEHWDAYEAIDGGPPEVESSDAVLAILGDLASECERALADGTMPVRVSADRLWLSSDGAIRLTEFSVSGASAAPPIEVREVRTAQAFLYAAGVESVGGDLARAPLPLAVRAVIDRIGQGGYATFTDIADALRAASRSAARISTPQRIGAVALGAVLVVLTLALNAWKIPAALALRQQPEIETLGLMLNRQLFLEGGRGTSVFAQWRSRNPGSTYTAPEREAFRIYVGDRFGALLSDSATWDLLDRYWSNGDAIAAAGKQARAAAAAASPDERRRAAQTAGAIVADVVQRPVAQSNAWLDQFLSLNADVAKGLFTFGAMAVVIALIFRGSVVLRLLGCGIAGPDGTRASWLRAWARTLFAWLPMLAACALFQWGLRMDLHAMVGPSLFVLANALMIGGAVVAVWRPAWSLHDRLAGTRIVPK